MSNSQDDAREAILKAIAENAATAIVNPATRAAALKDLAEAYAWVNSTNQPH